MMKSVTKEQDGEKGTFLNGETLIRSSTYISSIHLSRSSKTSSPVVSSAVSSVQSSKSAIISAVISVRVWFTARTVLWRLDRDIILVELNKDIKCCVFTNSYGSDKIGQRLVRLHSFGESLIVAIILVVWSIYCTCTINLTTFHSEVQS